MSLTLPLTDRLGACLRPLLISNAAITFSVTSIVAREVAMDSSWTNVAIVLFPWIGGGAAVVLLILLFGTHVLQSEPGTSKWYDRVWLSWLALTIYLLHNVEEYGIDVFGRHALRHPEGPRRCGKTAQRRDLRKDFHSEDSVKHAISLSQYEMIRLHSGLSLNQRCVIYASTPTSWT